MFEGEANRIVKNMVIATLEKINVSSGVCRYNFRCQYNTVHDALNDNHDKISMCFYLDGVYPIIHFINIDGSGNYIDNTLGRWSEAVDYYLIKTIHKDDFFDVDKIFTAYRKEVNKLLPFYIRWFSGITF